MLVVLPAAVTVVFEQVEQRAATSAEERSHSRALLTVQYRSDSSTHCCRRCYGQNGVPSRMAAAAIVAIVRLPVVTRPRSAAIGGLRVVTLTRNTARRVRAI